MTVSYLDIIILITSFNISTSDPSSLSNDSHRHCHDKTKDEEKIVVNVVEYNSLMVCGIHVD